MINPNGDEFIEDDPMAAPMQRPDGNVSGAQRRLQQTAQKFSDAAGDTWEQTKERASVARERTEVFLRENPVPTILGALALGLAIGLAIRYASRPEEPTPVTLKNALKNIDWRGMSEPAMPFLRKARRGYDDSADVVSQAVKEGIDRVKDIDVDRYVKPLRKRWNSWLS